MSPPSPYRQPHHHPTYLLPVYITLPLKLFTSLNKNNNSAGGAIGGVGGIWHIKQKLSEGGGSAAIAGIMRKQEVRNEREFIDTLFT